MSIAVEDQCLQLENGICSRAPPENMRNSPVNASLVRRALSAILTLLFGIAVAIMGSHVGGPLVVVGGVAVIVLGARLLRPLSHGILRWLDSEGA